MDLTYEHFADLIGERFHAVGADGIELELDLADAEQRAANPSATQGFSLVFRGDKLLEQQTFQVDHPRLGSHHIFLVPLAATEEGATYEAVFSRPSTP